MPTENNLKHIQRMTAAASNDVCDAADHNDDDVI